MLTTEERIIKAATDEREWDRLKDEGVDPGCQRPFGPSRNGSTSCKSYSIASGGNRDYCTCDTCF